MEIAPSARRVVGQRRRGIDAGDTDPALRTLVDRAIVPQAAVPADYIAWCQLDVLDDLGFVTSRCDFPE